MHRSRLAGFIIDCQSDDLEAAAQFWSAALGLALSGKAADDPGYRHLSAPSGPMHVEVQQVAHPSRVHLDIETDDLEAEASRLEALGATRVRAVKRWIVMQAPTGQRFCVVRGSEKSLATANRWGEQAARPRKRVKKVSAPRTARAASPTRTTPSRRSAARRRPA